MTEQTTTCARCGDPIAAPYPVLIVGKPYHADCASAEEIRRQGLFACLHCLDLFPAKETVMLTCDHFIVCIDCKERHYPHEDATLMSVVIAEQNRGADESRTPRLKPGACARDQSP